MVVGDARRQPHRRRGRARPRPAATRARPRSAVSCFSVGQTSTSPAWPDAVRDVRGSARGAAVRPGVRAGDRRRCGRPRPAAARPSGTTGRAARAATAARRAPACAANASPVAANMCGRGALEAVDRLLLVADGEQRARHARARRCRRRTPRPARGSPATAPGSCPAPRRPGCGRGRRRACRAPTRPPPMSASRLAALRDQVVEVERRAPRLGLAVALQHGVAEPDAAPWPRRAARSLRRSASQRHEARLRPRQQRSTIGMLGRQRPCVIRLLRGSPSVQEAACAERSMRPRCAARLQRGGDAARTLLMSLAEPAARTSRSRAQLRVATASRQARSSMSSRLRIRRRARAPRGRSSPRSAKLVVARRRRGARPPSASRCSRSASRSSSSKLPRRHRPIGRLQRLARAATWRPPSPRPASRRSPRAAARRARARRGWRSPAPRRPRAESAAAAARRRRGWSAP